MKYLDIFGLLYLCSSDTILKLFLFQFLKVLPFPFTNSSILLLLPLFFLESLGSIKKLSVPRVIETINHFWTFWRVSNSDSDCDTAIRRHLANKFIINFPHYVNTRCDMKGNWLYIHFVHKQTETETQTQNWSWKHFECERVERKA